MSGSKCNYVSYCIRVKSNRMDCVFYCILVVLCCSRLSLSASNDDTGDFIDEKGKALNNLKVVPGSKRGNVDYHNVEQEAGKAVLKLLDAKIGKKVSDAAKEVTDFLNDAVGHHAKQRTKKIQSDKEKEISLLHLGAKKVLTHKPEDNKPKKNKDGSFLVNFKIPYIVTPVVKKKKPKAKKFQPKKVKKPHHIKKFHHRIVHHKKHYPQHYHHAHVQDVNRPPAAPQPSYSRPPAPAAPQQAPPPNYNAIDLTFNGYNWTYKYANDQSSDRTPCQGNCMDPCTQACSMSQDCCCCDPNMMTQMQGQMTPAAAYLTQVTPAPPMYQPSVLETAAQPPASCPLPCKRNCFTYCPEECCGIAGKRDEVIGSEGSGKEQTTEQDSGSAKEALEQNEKKIAKQQEIKDRSQEGSSNDNIKDENVE